jgi:hypothetical protein
MFSSEVVVGLIMVLLVTQLTVFVYRCVAFQQLKKKTFPYMVGLTLIGTSVLFTAVAGTLVFFTGSGEEAVCQAASWTCIILYMATKGQLYLFFIERMHIVHRSPSQTRMESPLYIFNMCLLVPFVALFVVMILYRVAYVGDDEQCRHGLRRESTIPTVLYDTMFSIYSIAVFVWPLFKSQSLRRSDGLRWVVKKNIIGSVVSTVSTFLNAFSLSYREIQEPNICLLRCTADVMINVMVMNYLISNNSRNNRQDQSNYSSYRDKHGVSSTSAHCGEIDAVSTHSSKIYPISQRSGCSQMSISEVTMMPTTRMTTIDNASMSTLTKESVLEECLDD